mgnify:CR=1 FL=1
MSRPASAQPSPENALVTSQHTTVIGMLMIATMAHQRGRSPRVRLMMPSTVAGIAVSQGSSANFIYFDF